jgi:hypothetical protein
MEAGKAARQTLRDPLSNLECAHEFLHKLLLRAHRETRGAEPLELQIFSCGSGLESVRKGV